MNTELSHRWRYGVVLVALTGLSVLLWIALNTYTGGVGTPIPERVVGLDGQTVFTGADIIAGQQVFQKHALMENGTIWGHGAYLGPDFSAAYLHQSEGCCSHLADLIFSAGRAGTHTRIRSCCQGGPRRVSERP